MALTAYRSRLGQLEALWRVVCEEANRKCGRGIVKPAPSEGLDNPFSAVLCCQRRWPEDRGRQPSSRTATQRVLSPGAYQRQALLPVFRPEPIEMVFFGKRCAKQKLIETALQRLNVSRRKLKM